MSAPFELHPQLANDTFEVTRLQVCRVLLVNDASYPWLILVPEISGLRDWHDVPEDRQITVLTEVNRASRALAEITRADKMNVAALGNQVPQLHIHVIARHAGDAAWPRPVWGQTPPVPYVDDSRASLVGALLGKLTVA